jgi:hypothetical protein
MDTLVDVILTGLLVVIAACITLWKDAKIAAIT